MDEERFAQKLAGLTPVERERVRELVAGVVERDRLIARAEGEKAAMLAELAQIAHADGARSGSPDGVEYARRAMACEVAAATRVHPSAAKNRMEAAERLVADYPTTHEALCEGRISKRHADVIADTGVTLDPGARASLDAHVVAFAESRTPRETEKIAKLRAAQLEPRSLRERHQEARAERRVTVTEREDGMSELWAYLPTLEARAVHDRLTQMSKTIKTDRRRARSAYEREHGYAPEQGWGMPVIGGADGADDDAVAASDRRTMDQLRADLFADLLLTAAPTGHDLHQAGTGAALAEIAATVQVTIPCSLIIDPDDGTSWVDEGGLVSPDSARILAGNAAGWERLFTRPETGEIVAVDRYRPSESQQRALIGRDVTCRFPGCTAPARKADVDHTRDYALSGVTDVSNLAHLCEAHHVMKHHSDWKVRQLAGGVMEWTSPTGQVYTDEPISRVFFRDDPDLHAERERLRREEQAREQAARERQADVDAVLARVRAEADARELEEEDDLEFAFGEAIANGLIPVPEMAA